MYRPSSRLRRRALAAVAAIALVPVMAAPAFSSQPGGRPPAALAPAAASVAAVDWVPQAPTKLAITTTNNAPVVSKDTYVTGSMSLAGSSYSLKIKGRGNSTWNMPKKPYKLKLDSAASLLGMPSDNEWVLLANFADRASLRNYLALMLGAQLRMIWTPRVRFVDVTLNGDRLGTYMLTEQVKQAPDRVALPSGGLLLEVDARMTATDPGFVTAHKVPLAFNDPSDLTDPQKADVQAAVSKFETALYGAGFASPTTGYRAYVDLDSFVDWYLLNELFKNVDADFFSSDYVTWTPGGRFAMGPPWDFDLSAGYNSGVGATVKDPAGWWVRRGASSAHALHNTHWIARMFDDPYFAALVRTRWNQLRPMVDAMIGQIPAAAGALGTSVANDWARWHATGGSVPQVGGSVHATTYAGEVTFLQNWFKARVAWMSAQHVSWGRSAVTVRENAGTVRLPVTLADVFKSGSFSYATASGTAKAGSDFTARSGTVTFTGTDTAKTISVPIINDRAAEGPQTFKVVLSKPSAGTVVTAPTTLTVTIATSDQQPDLRVSTVPSSGYVGFGLFNTTGAGQTKTASLRRTQAHSFYVRVGNAGGVRSTIVVKGSRAPSGSQVRYYDGSVDVTSRMQSAAGYTRSVAGGYRQIRVWVKVLGTAAVGSHKTAVVTGTWTGDGTRTDVVKAVATVRR